MQNILNPASWRASTAAANFAFVRPKDLESTELASALMSYDQVNARTVLIVVVCPQQEHVPPEWLSTLAAASESCSSRVLVVLHPTWEETSVVHDTKSEEMGQIPYAQATYDVLATAALRAFSFSRRFLTVTQTFCTFLRHDL